MDYATFHQGLIIAGYATAALGSAVIVAAVAMNAFDRTKLPELRSRLEEALEQSIGPNTRNKIDLALETLNDRFPVLDYIMTSTLKRDTAEHALTAYEHNPV